MVSLRVVKSSLKEPDYPNYLNIKCMTNPVLGQNKSNCTIHKKHLVSLTFIHTMRADLKKHCPPTPTFMIFKMAIRS